MQPHSEIGNQSTSKNNNINCQRNSHNNNKTTGESTTPPAASRSNLNNQRQCNLVKGKQPLVNFKFYLDIRDHQQSRKVEEQIAALGGSLEFFLTDSVTHFITDKQINLPVNSNCSKNSSSLPGTPQTPGTPLTPYSYDQTSNVLVFSSSHTDGGSNRLSSAVGGGGGGSGLVGGGVDSRNCKLKKQSRADAMLHRARRQSQNTNTANEQQQLNFNHHPHQQQQLESAPDHRQSLPPYYVTWHTDYAFRFFKKVTNDLKQYLASNSKNGLLTDKHQHRSCEAIQLKSHFIKIESIHRNYRPYYQVFNKTTEWPRIELNKEQDGAFRVSPQPKPSNSVTAAIVVIDTVSPPSPAPLNPKIMTRKSRSSSNRHATAAAAAAAGLRSSLKQPGEGGGVTAVQQQQPTNNHHHQQQQKQKDQQPQITPSTDKQCGVCEICKIEYDTLTIHLKTKDHEFFAKNSQNFIALDSLIKSSANVNKFLDENKKNHKSIEAIDSRDANAILKEQPTQEMEANMLNEADGDSSTALQRKKSKRSSKGSKRRSSEKKHEPTAVITSPPTKQCKVTSPVKHSTYLELGQLNVTVPVTPTSRKKPRVVAASLSPPIRQIMPTSSLYKVVESNEVCTTPRKNLGIASDASAAVGSPSLIVKFRKVRQTELSVLNGEAENFMFPKKNTSQSEVATDADRQTTSESTQNVSSNLSSSDRISEPDLEVEEERNFLSAAEIKATKRRRPPPPTQTNNQLTEMNSNNHSSLSTGEVTGHHPQSFPNAPIQPAAAPASVPAIEASSSESIALKRVKLSPSSIFGGATRKSSRTATAIVSAATKSSRLLRAATENSRRSSKCQQRRQSSRLALEDRMGGHRKRRYEEVNEDQDEDEDDDYEEFRSVTPPPPLPPPTPPVAPHETDLHNSSDEVRSLENAKDSPALQPSKFDIKQSEQLSHQRYSFERLPYTELWYKVFSRQDACNEKMFEYYGSTSYRKLPYELGPIPFNRTTGGSNAHCQLCLKAAAATNVDGDGDVATTSQKSSKQQPKADHRDVTLLHTRIKSEKEPPADPPPSRSPDEPHYTYHKHKKHHLHRYRKEQQEQQKQIVKQELPLSKDSTPDPIESINTNSNSSSSCPSNLSCTSSKKILNKHLSKTTFLNLELPPRKSPREHASTLAILSCIIKQRQDSMSKTNSETDEPPTTPTTVKEEKDKKSSSVVHPPPQSTTPPPPPPQPTTPPPPPSTIPTQQQHRASPVTRKQTATPIEEMRFVSEISENVKRLRRGLNKYDESPVARTFATRSPRLLEQQQKHRKSLLSPAVTAKEATVTAKETLTPLKLHQQLNHRHSNRRRSQTPAISQKQSLFQFPPQVKKSAAKKKTGIEYQLSAANLKALDAALKPTQSCVQLEWEIDKHLSSVAGCLDVDEAVVEIQTPPDSDNSGKFSGIHRPADQPSSSSSQNTKSAAVVNSDIFSSDFDLVDLIDSPNGSDMDGDDDPLRGGFVPADAAEIGGGSRLRDYSTATATASNRNSIFDFFSSSHNYFKKRKNLKVNRTGWPKSKKKSSLRQLPQQQQQPVEKQLRLEHRKIRFLCEGDGNDEDFQPQRQTKTGNQGGVMTPPYTDIDDKILRGGLANSTDVPPPDEVEDEEDDGLLEAESIPEDDDDDDDDEEDDEDNEAPPSQEGDDDERESEDDEEQVEEDEEDADTAEEDYEPSAARLSIAPTINCKEETTTTTTTAPTTPQLNGYMSPSEKADNSDIFTVSSDGLETDLDLSNSQIIKTEDDGGGGDDAVDFCVQEEMSIGAILRHTSSPKKKFEVSKLATCNNHRTTCAAAAAAAAASTSSKDAKSLAISNILKKQVKVSCRRLHAPFRRYRSRR